MRMGITILKLFFCGGISLDKQSEIVFYSSVRALPSTEIQTVYLPNEFTILYHITSRLGVK